MLPQPFEHSGAWEDLVHGPVGSATNVHVLNKTHFGTNALTVLQQINELVIVIATYHYCIELQVREANLFDGFDPLQHLIVRITPRQGLEPIGLEGIETYRNTM